MNLKVNNLIKIKLITLLLVDSIILFSGRPSYLEVTPFTVASEAPTDIDPTPLPDIQLTTIGPTIANCPLFPANNLWNARVDSLPTHPMSASWIDSIGRDESCHMDFGSGEWDGGPIGIPFNVVSVSITNKFNPDFYYPDESDTGPYPIPDNPLI